MSTKSPIIEDGMSYFLKYSLLVISCIIYLDSYALNTKMIEQHANTSISKLYHSIDALPNSSMVERLDWFSNYFKGTPYILGSLGEGANARYDQFPLYRTDGFDCDTYVNTMLALALSNSLSQFQQCINQLRYKGGNVSYIQRNHFTSIDWNKNNQTSGVLKDITLTIHNKNNKTAAIYASTFINKPNWYASKDNSTIRINNTSTRVAANRLAELKSKSTRLEKTTAKVPYLPFTALFPQKNKPDHYLFSQIPNGAIIEIVRPNWDLRKEVGTYLDISHLGFAFWQKGTLYFREASSKYGKIVDVPLIDYLNEATESPTIKGINVQIVVPKKPGYCG